LNFESVRTACERAKRIPSEQNSFRRLRLDQWLSQETRFIDMADWDRCAGVVDLAAAKELTWYGGLDLSTKLDVTALVLVSLTGDGRFNVLPHFWIPKDNLSDRSNQESAKYRQWADKGLITLTEGNEVDFAAVRRRLNDLRDKEGLWIEKVGFDPWNARQLCQQLTEDGFQMIEIGQRYQHLSEPTKELQAALVGGRVRHGGDPVLRWMADCMTVQQDVNGNVRPVKPNRLKTSKRIDGVVALVMAMCLAMMNQNDRVNYTGLRSVG
jgi:phage terminase large subunit-like protein